MAAAWREEETVKLIEVWGEDDIQEKLEGCTRNKHIYQKISDGMKAAGYDRSAIQCRENM